MFAFGVWGWGKQLPELIRLGERPGVLIKSLSLPVLITCSLK